MVLTVVYITQPDAPKESHKDTNGTDTEKMKTTGKEKESKVSPTPESASQPSAYGDIHLLLMLL
jgi:hypothetical protein